MLTYIFAKLRRRYNHNLAREISAFTRYYDCLIQYRPRSADNCELFSDTDCPRKQILKENELLPDLKATPSERVAILVNGNFNHSFDIQGLLDEIKSRLARTSRLVVVAYNPYLSPIFTLLTKMGIRKGTVPSTFITMVDIINFCKLSEFEVVRSKAVGLFPWKLLGLGTLIENCLLMIPILRNFAYMHYLILRPVIDEREKYPSLSIIIPARNEKGNIQNAITRLPNLGIPLEVIFVEGHSTDGTWDEILRVQKQFSTNNLTIKAYQQLGRGKSDSVRLGFSKATGELLTILDADLTMPPEDLPRFYDTYRRGLADFVNGSRLVYPMEGDAMRFLNRLGNIFFAKSLSFVLKSAIGDSLCGTKLLTRRDYLRFVRWRADFGEFDPFGDFELLFPASILAIGIVDVPVRYRARTYGYTNISRFRHGWMLLKMTVIGLFRVRLGSA